MVFLNLSTLEPHLSQFLPKLIGFWQGIERKEERMNMPVEWMKSKIEYSLRRVSHSIFTLKTSNLHMILSLWVYVSWF